MPMMISASKKAISLIELIAVMTIAIVIAGGVILAFSAVANKRLEATARSLAAELALIRQRAVSEHADFVVGFNTSSDRYNITTGTDTLKDVGLDVDIASVTDCAGTSQTQVRFRNPEQIFKNNLEVADTRCITLTSDGRTKIINITGQTGHIAIE